MPQLGRWMVTLFRTANDVLNQKIFDKSIDLILVTDRQGTFVRVSPSSSAILGYPPAEMIGHSAVEFIYHEDLENTRQMMRDQRIIGITRHFDCRYVHTSGAAIILTWTGTWSPDEEQHFFIGRDITDARVAEQYRAIAQKLEDVRKSISTLNDEINNGDQGCAT